MTQSFGYYCPSCSIRWRRSVCDLEKNICPSGHSLIDCYWIYRQERGRSIYIVISHDSGFKIHKTIPKTMDDFSGIRGLRAWVQGMIQEDSIRAPIFNNILETSSVGESAWALKCWLCKGSAKQRGYYPGELKRPHCQQEVVFASIYCKKFERDGKAGN